MIQRSKTALTVLSIVVALLVPVLLVLISVRLVMTETYLRLEYSKPDFPPDSYGFSLSDRLYFGPIALQYLLSDQGIEYLGNLTFRDGRPMYTGRELQHMVDVKNVLRATLLVLGMMAVLFAIIVIILIRSLEGRQALRNGVMTGGALMLVILVALVALLLVNWDAFFTGFHDLFFASGTWVFEFSDTLIRLFPVRFWQDAALTVGGMSGAGAVILMGISWWWARRARKEGL